MTFLRLENSEIFMNFGRDFRDVVRSETFILYSKFFRFQNVHENALRSVSSQKVLRSRHDFGQKRKIYFTRSTLAKSRSRSCFKDKKITMILRKI